MKNYYISKCIFLLMGAFIGHDALAYNARAIEATLNSSSHIRDIQLNSDLKITNGATSWKIIHEGSNIWELQHAQSQKKVFILKSSLKLSDLTKGSQVLLKEYGLLGLEILHSELSSKTADTPAVLKLELRKSGTPINLNQYLFEISTRSTPELYAVNCPPEISGSCANLVNSIRRSTTK